MACLLLSRGGRKPVSQHGGKGMRVCEVSGQPGEGAPRREGAERPERWVASLPAARGGPPRLQLAVCAAGGPARRPRGLAEACTGRRAASAFQAGGVRGVPEHLPRLRRGLPSGRGRHTHLLKSKGIVPPPPLPPGVGALQARWAAAPRGSQPAANASAGRPAPAGRPQPSTLAAASRRREVTLRAAHWAPPPPPAAPSAALLKGPGGLRAWGPKGLGAGGWGLGAGGWGLGGGGAGHGGRAMGVEAWRGREHPKTPAFIPSKPPHCVFHHLLSV